MKFGTNFLDSISQKIIDRELKYEDGVIIGDNSSGKSLLLRMLIAKKGITDEIYFIDAVNRGFDISKIVEESRPHEYKKAILSKRLQ